MHKLSLLPSGAQSPVKKKTCMPDVHNARWQPRGWMKDVLRLICSLLVGYAGEALGNLMKLQAGILGGGYG